MPDGDRLWIVLCSACAKARGAPHDRRYADHGPTTGACDDCRAEAVVLERFRWHDTGSHTLFAIRAASA